MYKYALSLGVSSLCLLAFITRRFVLQLTGYVALVLKTEGFVVWNILCILFRLHSRYLMAYLYSIVEYMGMCNTPNPLNFFFYFYKFYYFLSDILFAISSVKSYATVLFLTMISLSWPTSRHTKSMRYFIALL